VVLDVEQVEMLKSVRYFVVFTIQSDVGYIEADNFPGIHLTIETPVLSVI